MTDYPITRTKLLTALVDALEPLGYVQAFRESVDLEDVKKKIG